MAFKGGLKEAAKMLNGLDPLQRERILGEIGQKDPSMAEDLRKNLISLDDLRFLTPRMFQDLFKEIKIVDLGLALRIAPGDLKEVIFSNITSSYREEIDESLKGPLQSLQKVQECEQRILEKMRELEAKGKIVIRKTDDYV